MLHVLLFSSQSQPDNSSLLAINTPSHAMWVMPVWDSLSFFLLLTHVDTISYCIILCAAIFQPVAAGWQLRVSPCYQLFFTCYVSNACTRLSVFFFFFCYWNMLIKLYIVCTAIFQPVAAKWQLRVSPCSRFFFSSYVSYAHLRLSLSLLFVIDACWLTFILHVLLFFSQSQPDDSSLLATSHAMSVMPCWDSLFLVIDTCWLTFILHVLQIFSHPQPDDSSLLDISSSHAMWVMPG